MVIEPETATPVTAREPAESDRFAPTVISSTAPVLAEVRPRMRAVAWVRPLVVIEPANTIAA